MSIEDDLNNAFKYTGGVAGKNGPSIDPTKMMQAILTKLELSMLNQMDASIRARINVLMPKKQAETNLDPFIILGVNMNSTQEEVKKAWKDKAWKAHPDHGGNNEDMVKINAAYKAICMFKGWKE